MSRVLVQIRDGEVYGLITDSPRLKVYVLDEDVYYQRPPALWKRVKLVGAGRVTPRLFTEVYMRPKKGKYI